MPTLKRAASGIDVSFVLLKEVADPNATPRIYNVAGTDRAVRILVIIVVLIVILIRFAEITAEQLGAELDRSRVGHLIVGTEDATRAGIDAFRLTAVARSVCKAGIGCVGLALDSAMALSVPVMSSVRFCERRRRVGNNKQRSRQTGDHRSKIMSHLEFHLS